MSTCSWTAMEPTMRPAPPRRSTRFSSSNPRPVRDGFHVLWTIFRLMLEEHPVYFFGTLTILAGAAGVYFAYPVALDYLETGSISRLPSALLAAGLLAL